MSDDDTLLRVALHIDDGIDVDVLLRLLEGLHHHLDAVGYLLVVVEQDLLAYNLVDEEAGGLVCPLVLVEIGRGLGQEFLNASQQLLHAEAVQGRDGHYLCLRQYLVPLVVLCLQGLRVAQVYLVDDHDDGHLHVLDLLYEVAVLVGRLHHVRHIEQHIGILQGGNGELEHLLLQLVVGFQYSRGVREAYLHLGRVQYAHYAVTCGLCLECGYADTLSHKQVHQCGLAHVGVTHYVHETCLVPFPLCCAFLSHHYVALFAFCLTYCGTLGIPLLT